jgi:hypothetical protein
MTRFNTVKAVAGCRAPQAWVMLTCAFDAKVGLTGAELAVVFVAQIP